MKKFLLILLVCAFFCAQKINAQCSSFVPNQNTIYGLVFNDFNQNGNKGIFEPTLQNIGVNLYQDVNSNGILDSEDILTDSDISDNTGNYTLVAPELFTYENVADNFDTSSWSGNNGSINWNNDWQELGESGVTTGNVRVDNNKLRFGRFVDGGSNISGDGVVRQITTSAYSNGILSFDFSKSISSTSGQDFSVNVQISSDGTNFTTIDNISFSDTEQNYTYDVSSVIGGTTYVRFLGSGSVGSEINNFLYIDNIDLNLALGGGYGTDFLVVLDDATIPAGMTLTSANTIAVSFSGLGNRSCNNNFGLYSCGSSCAPNAFDDYASMIQGSSVIIDVLSNDFDGNNNIDTSSLVISTQPTNGSVSIDASGNLIYSPNGVFYGTDTFQYQICDSTFLTPLCDNATVTVYVEENYIDPCVQAVQEQVYYVPFSDDDLRTALYNSGNTNLASCNYPLSNEVNRVTSIKSPYPGTVIVYDHWEDGYEADINNPVQATTQVWGDEDVTNGTSPNYSNDYIPSGGDIVLENTYNYNPRNSTNIVYDGRDKIVTSNDIAMSAIAGDVDRFEIQLAKTDVYSVDKFGTSFTVPFGEDLGQEFVYTGLFARASEDGTTINIDLDNNGTVDATQTINEGEVMFIDGGVQSGAYITSNLPIGVDLFFGGQDCFGTRQINIYPSKFYSDVYYSPVPTTRSSAPAVVYFYNSLNRTIAIDWESNINTGTITIAAKSSGSLTLSDNSGYKFESQDGSSYVASEVIDSDATGQQYDWAFNLISEERLTDFTAIAWAPGTIDFQYNYNPVWVTPTDNTTIYIKYDGDLTDATASLSPCNIPYDESRTLNALNYTQIFDTFNADNDQGGLAVFTCDGTKIFSVYGQDANLATTGTGTGTIDVGTTMQPLCLKALVFANKDIAYGLFNTPTEVNVAYNDAQFLTNLDETSITTNGLQPQNGTIVINGDGTITYTPNDGFIGQDTFEYTICSLEFPGTCDIATVTVHIADCPTPGNKNIVYGQVFFDLDEDTVNNDDLGIDDININIYEDVNSNGLVDSGTDIFYSSVSSNSLGFYSFESPNFNVEIEDDFDSNTYSGGSGWSSNWTEVSDDNNSSSGDVQIWGTKRRLQIKNNKSAYRSANLSGVTEANISFKVYERGKIDASDDVTVEICSDNSFSNCQTLFFKANDFRSSTINGVLIDSDKITSNTTIRARVNGYTSSDEYFYIDNIVIRYKVNGENLVLEIDTASLPAGYIFSTDNVEVASFASGSYGSCAKSNDFGLLRCNLEDPRVEIICDDNGTPNDASDDGFNISLDPAGTRIGTTYTVTGDLSGSGTYGTPLIFGPFSNTDNSFVFTITDDSGNCSIDNYEIEVPSNYCLFSDSSSTLDFDGVDDYLDSTLNLSGYASASMMAWVKIDDTFSNTGTVLSQGSFTLSVDNNQTIKATLNETSISLPITSAISKNIWAHVAVVFDSSLSSDQVKIFINGSLEGTITNTSLTSVITSSSDSFNIGRNVSSNNQYFKGALDEVRVFDTALTISQLQQVIYQEIAEVSNNVGGVILPKQVKDTVNNSTISWANLQAYYQMNDVENSKTSDASIYGRTAELNNITTMQEQTAPIPFITSTDGNWASTTTWLHGNVWNLSELNNSGYAIAIVDNLLTTNSGIEVLGLIIEDNKKLTVNTDNFVKVNSYLELNGQLDLQQDSQLIQGVNSDLVTSVNGEILRRQEGNSSVYWYNYFSSPVSDASVSVLTDNNSTNNLNNTGFTLNNLQYGNGNVVTYTNAYHATGSISTYWMYDFINGVTYYDWAFVNPSVAIAPGTGYTQKGTGVGTEQQYIFKGKPNNGVIHIDAIDTGGPGSDPTQAGGYTKTDYLLGNPYPSALDIHKFIDDNAGVSDGSIRLWQQWSGNSHNLTDYNGGYAVVNKLASVKAYQFVGIEGGIDNTAQNGTSVPTRYLPVGQGFITEIIANGTIEFNNSQRVFIKETDADGSYSNGSVFFRSNNNLNNLSNSDSTISKFRLFMNAENGASRELVLGFSNITSDDFDYGYDAKSESFKADDLNLVLNQTPMVMQAYSPITEDKVIPLVFNATTSQSYTISIGAFEDFDANQDVFIKDNYTNTYHDIRQSDYTFTSQAGHFNDRFEIVFKDQPVLSTDDILFEEGVTVFFNNSNDVLVINGLKEDLKSVSLINMLGQQVITFNNVTIEDAKYGISITGLSSGAYLVNLTGKSRNGTKKIIIE
ncbi:LamG-like jellyroll fold domain-containing protein [Olleya aquimaris]|uniref:Putative secreted protein (Por secretion system target) n=1 Tax=Olleya aquimaris TaxID=639310 RepID=A0A327RN46_9FLAO|nr:LamG-like jellyroll fold domain-containing protein [Olleya aquimaris]RAJ16963.1 putative secreted protein (Por secretion system target) [Olleya aquimaris]